MMTFIKSQFTQLGRFFRDELRHYLFITGVAFLILIVISFAIGYSISDLAENLMQWFSQQISDLGVMDEAGNFSAAALFINNFRSMLLSTCYGFIPFLYLPAVSLGVNSMLLGMFAAVYVHNDISLIAYLAGILPHGIFELPALIIALSCGIYLCSCVTDFVRHNTKGVMLPAMLNIARTFVIVQLPLLLLAAVVEAYVTPLVMALFL